MRARGGIYIRRTLVDIRRTEQSWAAAVDGGMTAGNKNRIYTCDTNRESHVSEREAVRGLGDGGRGVCERPLTVAC